MFCHRVQLGLLAGTVLSVQAEKVVTEATKEEWLSKAQKLYPEQLQKFGGEKGLNPQISMTSQELMLGKVTVLNLGDKPLNVGWAGPDEGKNYTCVRMQEVKGKFRWTFVERSMGRVHIRNLHKECPTGPGKATKSEDKKEERAQDKVVTEDSKKKWLSKAQKLYPEQLQKFGGEKGLNPQISMTPQQLMRVALNRQDKPLSLGLSPDNGTCVTMQKVRSRKFRWTFVERSMAGVHIRNLHKECPTGPGKATTSVDKKKKRAEVQKRPIKQQSEGNSGGNSSFVGKSNVAAYMTQARKLYPKWARQLSGKTLLSKNSEEPNLRRSYAKGGQPRAVRRVINESGYHCISIGIVRESGFSKFLFIQEPLNTKDSKEARRKCWPTGYAQKK